MTLHGATPPVLEAVVVAGTADALTAAFAVAPPGQVRHRAGTGRQGRRAAGNRPGRPPGARFLGTTSPRTRERVSFTLKAQNLPQLEQGVESGWHGGYLTVSQFAGSYGQTPANVAALENYLARYGITTQAYADRLDVSATGIVGEFNQEYCAARAPGPSGPAAGVMRDRAGSCHQSSSTLREQHGALTARRRTWPGIARRAPRDVLSEDAAPTRTVRSVPKLVLGSLCRRTRGGQAAPASPEVVR